MDIWRSVDQNAYKYIPIYAQTRVEIVIFTSTEECRYLLTLFIFRYIKSKSFVAAKGKKYGL